MPPPVIGGQQVRERGEQVGVAAGTKLEQRHARRGVRHEDMQQAIAATRSRPGELRALAGDVPHRLPPASSHPDYLALHSSRIIGALLARGDDPRDPPSWGDCPSPIAPWPPVMGDYSISAALVVSGVPRVAIGATDVVNGDLGFCAFPVSV